MYKTKYIHTFMIMIISLCFIMFFGIASKASPAEEEYAYTSYRISYGDTIDSIVSTHSPYTNMSFEDYKYELRRLNRLSTDMIYAGDYLILPVLLAN